MNQTVSKIIMTLALMALSTQAVGSDLRHHGNLRETLRSMIGKENTDGFKVLSIRENVELGDAAECVRSFPSDAVNGITSLATAPDRRVSRAAFTEAQQMTRSWPIRFLQCEEKVRSNQTIFHFGVYDDKSSLSIYVEVPPQLQQQLQQQTQPETQERQQ